MKIKNLIHENNISNKDFLDYQNENKIKETNLGFQFNGKADSILLNNEQEKIFQEISRDNLSKYSCHLIDGVTGSGKTEFIFLNLFLKL